MKTVIYEGNEVAEEEEKMELNEDAIEGLKATYEDMVKHYMDDDVKTPWYALMRDREDDDWGSGGYDLHDVAQDLIDFIAWNDGEWTADESYICVVDENGSDNVAIGTISVDDITK